MSKRVAKRTVAKVIDAAASYHWQSCPSGYMFCKCELAKALRAMANLNQRKRKRGQP